jgi:hypothetical protein
VRSHRPHRRQNSEPAMPTMPLPTSSAPACDPPRRLERG